MCSAIGLSDLLTQFDMFSDEPLDGSEPAIHQPSGRSTARQMTDAEMVAHLTASGRYRILQKLEPRDTADFVRPGFALNGVILDTETTGLNHRNEDIMEIGLIAFTCDEQGGIGDVTGVYGGLQ
jgi:DNA polymerase III subunit epsilon